uniref:Angiopoietin 4 n=1 Tax=Astyanax mexicanus TaxID=7994 RepID=A0A3B1ITC0_ASTMX
MKLNGLHWGLALLLAAVSALPVSAGNGNGQKRGPGERRRKVHRLQHGQCSYTFILPEMDGCRGGSAHSYGGSNVVQRDAPPGDGEWSVHRLQHLETAMENNTQWLQKLENYIQVNIKSEMVHIQANAVHNQTATMLEIGTNLLTQTAEQTRKLNVVEAKVINQTSRLEIQLLEHSLSTNKLEKELLVQTSEISRLRDKNSRLESKVLVLETQQRTELEDMREEKERLRDLVGKQSAAITALERQLRAASSNNSALQRQQQQLMKSVHTLINLVSPGTGTHPEKPYFMRNCAEIYKSAHNNSGVYDIYIGEATEPTKVFCDMETSGGGWTVFQRRINGSVDFQRGWKEYKMGFGDPGGEHWLGNEAVHLITSRSQYSLRVELRDWEGNAPYSLYEKFQLAGEKQQYRLLLRGYSGTAGQHSSLASHGTSFSTRDSDNDNCLCKCALMLTGGWWFDACGLSNLNGMYYTLGQNIRKLNGIKWHHFRGPSYSLKSTAMMIRPADF